MCWTYLTETPVLMILSFIVLGTLMVFLRWLQAHRPARAFQRLNELEKKPNLPPEPVGVLATTPEIVLKKDVLANLAFDFPYIELKEIGDRFHELVLVATCTNTTDKKVNLGKLELKAGPFTNQLVFSYSLVSGVNPVVSVRERVRLKQGKHEYRWSISLSLLDTKALVEAMDVEGAVQTDIRIWVIDEKKYWPDNPHLRHPDQGWRGSIKIIDHPMRMEDLETLCDLILRVEARLHKKDLIIPDPELFGYVAALGSHIRAVPGLRIPHL